MSTISDIARLAHAEEQAAAEASEALLGEIAEQIARLERMAEAVNAGLRVDPPSIDARISILCRERELRAQAARRLLTAFINAKAEIAS